MTSDTENLKQRMQKWLPDVFFRQIDLEYPLENYCPACGYGNGQICLGGRCSRNLYMYCMFITDPKKARKWKTEHEAFEEQDEDGFYFGGCGTMVDCPVCKGKPLRSRSRDRVSRYLDDPPLNKDAPKKIKQKVQKILDTWNTSWRADHALDNS